jgi:hypothetical protein
MSSAQAVEHLPQKHEALPDVKPQYYQKKKTTLAQMQSLLQSLG